MSTTGGRRPCPGSGRSSFSTISSRSSAITCGPPSRASTRSTSPGTKGRTPTLSTADVLNGLVAASEKAGAVAKSTGDVAKALGEGTKLEATYHVPFLAHAPMEPMNCTVHVRPDACEIWVGNQVITRAQGIAAQADRASAREGYRPQPSDRRRFRPAARSGLHRQGGAHRAEGRRARQGHLDARRGHPAGALPAVLFRPLRSEPIERQDHGVESQDRRLVDTGALGASGLQGRARR